jgi:Domain of unknown function (DUF5642)
MRRQIAVLPTSTAGRVLVVAGGLVLTAAVIAAGVFWLRRTPPGPDIDSSRVTQIRQHFPAGYEFRDGKRVVSQKTLDSMKTPKDGELRPAACAKLRTEGVDKALGETIFGVNAYGAGLFYVISAQELPATNKPHEEPHEDCSYMNVTYPDGFAITTPAEPPVISGLKVTGTHTATNRAGKVIDSYHYETWIDGHHAVTLLVDSDPTATPPSNPIDPTMAKQLFAESVSLVRGR